MMKIRSSVAGITLFFYFSSYVALAQQIVVDGNTQTSLSINGRITDVSTVTIRNQNAFNSFTQFDVHSGNVVNLHLPTGTSNLMNLVHGKISNIDGILNSVMNGDVGGNVYFANPHGFVVGSGGVINVGSLSLSTPTKGFLDNFFDSPGNPSASAVISLQDMAIPLSDSGLITIDGTINARGDIRTASQALVNTGTIQSGAAYQTSEPDFSDVTNTTGIESGTAMRVENGEVVLFAAGDISSSGTIANNGGDDLDAGNIRIEARGNITLDNGSTTTARGVGTNSAGGDISFTAIAVENPSATDLLFNDRQATASITINNADIRGENITATATANTNKETAESDSPILEAVTGWGLSEISGFIGITRSIADASIIVNSGADLQADGSININATAESQSTMRTLGFATAASGNISNAHSRVDINSGASLQSGGTIDLTASSINTAITTARASSGNVGSDVTHAETFAHSTSDAHIASGASVNAADLNVSATNTNSMDTTANAAGLPGAAASTLGAAVALSQLTSAANAGINADLDVSGDVNIDATSTNLQNATSAKAKPASALLSAGVKKLMKIKEPRQANPVGVAVAVAISNNSNEANATVGGSADLESNNISVTSLAEDAFSIAAASKAADSTLTLSGSVIYGDYTNTANAYIDENAEVDAAGELMVMAEAKKQKVLDGTLESLSQIRDVSDIASIIDLSNQDIVLNFADTLASSTASGNETGVAGGTTLVDVENSADAYIAKGAQINQDNVFQQSVDTALQKVIVMAKSLIDTLNISGILSSASVDKSGKDAASGGGFYNQIDYLVNSRAFVADEADVAATTDLEIHSQTEENLIGVTVAGNKSGNFAAVGAVANMDVTVNNSAFIDNKANISVGNDIKVTADDTVNFWNLTGGVTLSKSVGVGFSWATNKLVSLVQAFIGNDPDPETTDSTAVAGTIEAGNDINLDATSTHTVTAIGVAGGFATGLDTSGGKDSGKGKYGYGASGSVSFNTIQAETYAWVGDAVTVRPGLALNIKAINNSTINAWGGGVSGAVTGGLGGAFANNSLVNKTKGYIDGALIELPTGTPAGAVKYSVIDIESMTTGEVNAYSAGLAGSGSGGGSIAGSISINDTTDESEAYIKNATVNAGAVDLLVMDTRSIDNVTGGIAISTGGFGVGPSAGFNNITNTSKAYLEGTTITRANSVKAKVDNANTIRALSAHISGAGGFGGSGSLSFNTIRNTSEAYALGTTVGEALHDLSFEALDNSTIKSLSGAGSYGTSAGVGISAAYNDIGNIIKAYLDSSNLNADRDVKVVAESTASIETIGAGVGASSGVGLAGSLSINRLHNEVNAAIRNSSNIVADGSVLAAANNMDSLFALAGSISGGSNAGGGAVLLNIIRNKTNASIVDSNVNADANYEAGNPQGLEILTGGVDESDENLEAREIASGVLVQAFTREDVTSANVNGSGGSGVGVALSTSISTIKDETRAFISGSDINQPDTIPGYVDDASSNQQVRVNAYERVEFGGGSGNGAGGGAGGVGVGIDATIVKNTTQAYIENNSDVHANQLIDLAATHRENVLSASVGGAGGGTAGVVGSGNGVRLESTTEAFVSDSDLASDDEISATAEEVANLAQIAGGGAGGGAFGGAGAVAVGILKNITRAFLGEGTTTEAAGATTVEADSTEVIDHYAISLSGGGAVGVAATTSVKVANSTTQASINDNVQVNQLGATGNSDQLVTVDAHSDLNILGATGGASGGGTVGGGAAVDIGIVKNTTAAYVGEGADVTAGGDLLVKAEAVKNVDSWAVGGGGGGFGAVSAMVSVVNVGAKLDGETLDEVGDSGSYADDQLSGDITQGAGNGDDFATAATAEASADNSGDGVNDDINEQAVNKTSAFVGNNAVLDSGGTLTVTSTDGTTVSQNVGGLGISGGLTVGGSVGVTNSNAFNESSVGSGATIRAAGDVEVTADTTNDLDSNALAGSGGIVGLGAAVAIVNETGVTRAALEQGAMVTQAQQVTVGADADLDNDTLAFGATGGGAAVGVSLARNTVNAVTTAQVGDNVRIGMSPGQNVNSLSVDAVSDIDANAHTVAGAAGIVTGSGSDARTSISSTTNAGIGAGSQVKVADDVLVRARALTGGKANAEGASLAGLNVGISIARADATPLVTAGIGSNTVIDTGDSINVVAAHNEDADGNELLDKLWEAVAFSASGSLVGGVGGDARASIDPTVNARVGSFADLNAQGDIGIAANSVAQARARASGFAYAVAAGGLTKSIATIDNHTTTQTGDGVVMNGDNIDITGAANLKADSNTTGGNGGLISAGGTTARTRIDNAVLTEVGENNELSATDKLRVASLTQLDAASSAQVSAGGGVTINQVSADTDVVNSTVTDIKENALLRADNVIIEALVTKLRAYAMGKSSTIAAGSDSEASSFVDVESNADVKLRSGAELIGQTSVTLRSRTSGLDIDSIADANIAAGLTGNLLAESHADLDVNSNIMTEQDSIITSQSILIEAETVAAGADFNRDADADANTVVNWVLTRTTELVKTVESIPIIGWIVKWVRKTVYKWVAEILQSDVREIRTGGDPVTDNQITLNGTLAQLSALSPELTVNPDGSFTTDGNISAEHSNGEVVVNGVANTVAGGIDIRSPGGTVEGTGTLLLSKTFDSVNITNNSNYNLRLNSVDVTATSDSAPDLFIDADQNLTQFDIVTEVDVTDINVTGNTGADIIFAGRIANPSGETNVYNLGGDIYTDGGLVESNRISLNATGGNLGQQHNPLTMYLVKEANNAELSALAGGNAYLDVVLAEYLPSPPAGHVVDGIDFVSMAAGGTMQVALQDAIVFDIPEDPGLDPSPSPAMGRYYGGSAFATQGDLLVHAASMADFSYDELASSSGSVSLILDSGDAAITSISAANGTATVQAPGSIFNGATSGGANITASSIALNAATGTVGTPGQALELSQTNTGRVDINAAGSVTLSSNSGGLRLGEVNAGSAEPVSISTQGDIANGSDNPATVNITGDSVTLNSSAGAIGDTSSRLVVNSGDTHTSTVDAAGASGVYLEERSGDLRSSNISATAGSVDLLAAANADLNKVTAQGDVDIVVGGSMLTVADIDPVNVRLVANGADSLIAVSNMAASNSISASADTVTLTNVVHTGSAGSTLDLAVTGDLFSNSITSALGGLGIKTSGDGTLGYISAAEAVSGSFGSELYADTIVSINESIDLLVGGDAELGHVSAPDDVTIEVLGTLLNIDTIIDPRTVTLKVRGANSELEVGELNVSDSLVVNADYIDIGRIVHGASVLHLSISGNDGLNAEEVRMSVETNGSLVYDLLRSNYGGIVTNATALRFDDFTVGQIFEIETGAMLLTLDYKDSKQNEKSLPHETRGVPITLNLADTKVETDGHPNLFIKKSKK